MNSVLSPETDLFEQRRAWLIHQLEDIRVGQTVRIGPGEHVVTEANIRDLEWLESLYNQRKALLIKQLGNMRVRQIVHIESGQHMVTEENISDLHWLKFAVLQYSSFTGRPKRMKHKK